MSDNSLFRQAAGRPGAPPRAAALASVLVAASALLAAGLAADHAGAGWQSPDAVSSLILPGYAFAQTPPDHAFVTTWTTTAANQQVTLPVVGSGMTVFWGDGSTAEGVSGHQNHTYAAAGTYTVSIIGGLTRINMGSSSADTANAALLASIEQWGNSSWTTMDSAFHGASSMVYRATDEPDLSHVTDMREMFQDASRFNGDISSWNVTGVTHMDSMFRGATAFDQPLNRWDVSSVTGMTSMFQNATAFDQPLDRWDVSSVTHMSGMFRLASSFNQDISGWDVSSVTKTASMFDEATAFDQPLNSWNVSRVTGMNNMFRLATAFDQPLDRWDVSSAITMNNVFNGADSFSQNLGPWYVTPGTADFDAAGSSLRVTQLTAQNAVLSGHRPVYGIGEGGDSAMFEIISGSTLAFKNTPTRNGNHTANVTASDGTVFEDGNNWRTVTVNVTGASPPAHAFVTTWTTTAANSAVTFPGSGTYDVSWGDGVTQAGVSDSQEHTYAAAGTYTVVVTGGLERFNLNDGPSAASLASVEQWGNASWTSMADAFRGATNMVYGATDTPNLSGVTDMSNMFNAAASFNGNISSWNVSTVTSMAGMFRGAAAFNQPLDGWDVSAVTSMRFMFRDADSFNQPLDGWDVSSVTIMAAMFSAADSFNQPLDGWDVSAVTSMNSMFSGAAAFNQPLDGWNVSAVTQMNTMFSGAAAFNQPLDGWDVSAVTGMDGMFRGAAAFNQPLDGWDVSAVTGMNFMFSGATAFEQNLGPWYVTLDDPAPTVSSADRVAATISPQNQILAGHNPAYSVTGEHADLFEVAGGDTLQLREGRGVTGNATYQVTIQAAGGSLFGSGNARTVTVAAAAPPDHAFVTTWRTASADQTVTIPTGGSTAPYAVDWGDGSVTSYDSGGDAVHTYESPGTYTVFITGGFERIRLTDGTIPNAARLLTVHQWGNASWTSMEGAFAGASEMVLRASDEPDLSGVTDMSRMFDGASSFNGDLSGWNVSRVTGMSQMFDGASSFNQDISAWNVSAVTSMNFMFEGASSFNGDISAWDVSAVTTMNFMFDSATAFNGDLSSWDVSSVTGMSEMFRRASSFNGDISAWNVSAVTNMNNMFRDARAFNQDISSWDVSSVTGMSEVFRGASSFNGNISAWDVSAATTMHRMFSGANSFNQNISGWNVGAVTDMFQMFRFADSFNQDISSWDVSAVTDMDSMFLGANSFEQNLGPWYITPDTADFDAAGTSLNVTEMAAQNAVLDNHNPTYNIGPGPNRDLFEVVSGSSTLAFKRTPPSNGDHTVNVTASDGTVFEDGNNHRLVTVTVTGASDAPPAHAFVTTWRTTAANQNITFPGTGTYDIDWGDGQTDEGVSASQTHTYAAADTYTVSVTGGLERFSLNNAQPNAARLSSIEQWGTASWTSMARAFYGAENMAYRASDKPDLSSVTDMSWMFLSASSFDGDISAWDVSGVTDMNSMFNGASSFDGDISAWDVSGVTGMNSMFNGASSFNGNISAWNVSGVTDMNSMFNGASSFNGNISAWNVSAVTDMASMFRNADSFNQPLSTWNVSAVTGMSSMFSGASSFNGNISGWDVSAVTSMSWMFLSAASFNQPLSTWDVSRVTGVTSMFDGASSFNGNISTWDVSSVASMYSMFSGASSFNQPLDAWDVSRVTDATRMFSGASSFNGNISTWDVSSVASMYSMFSGASSFNQPLNSWDVSAVTDMESMFNGASSFNQPLDAWDVSAVTYMNLMFSNATSFEQNLGPWYVTLDDPDPIVSPADRVAAGISAQNDFLGGHNPTYTVYSPGLFEVADGATLRLKANQTVTPGATYQVVINATGDLFGTGNAATFPVMTAPDMLPPTFTSAAYSTGSGKLAITFSESLNDTAHPNRLHIRDTGESSGGVTLSGTPALSGSTLTLTLTATQRSAVLSMTTPQLDIEQNAVFDVAGNGIAADTDRTITINDTSPPTFTSAAYSTGSGKLAITFSESLNDTAHPNRLHIRDTGESSGGVTLSGTPALSGSTLTLTLTATQRSAVLSMTTPQLDIEQNAVFDVAGNGIASAADRTITINDTSPPTFTSAAYSTGSGKLAITFSESLNDTAHPNRLHIRDTGESSGGVTLSGTPALSGSTLTLTLTATQRSAVLSMTTPQLDIEQNAVFDVAGNGIAVSAADRTISMTTPQLNDTSPPTFTSAAYSTGSGNLAITFSESLNDTAHPNRLHIRDTGESSGGVTLSGTPALSGSTLTLTLTATQRSAVLSMTTPQLDIEQNAVFDVAGNGIASAADRTITINDTSPPTFTSAAYSTGSGKLAITFSESLNDTAHPNRLHIRDTGESSGGVTLSGTLAITFSRSTRPNRLHIRHRRPAASP